MTDRSTLTTALQTLLSELGDGGSGDACYVLNPTDPGILRSLARISAADASCIPAAGGASIAAHVDHLCYGLELLNRYAAGEEDAFATADYSRSWERTTVSEAEWQQLRERLAAQLHTWRDVLGELSPDVQLHVTGAIASIVHLAYHLGAIRQIDRALAGPPAPRE